MKQTEYDLDACIDDMERHEWHPAIQTKYRAYLNYTTPPYFNQWDWMDSIGAHEIAAICSEWHERLKQLNPNLIEQ